MREKGRKEERKREGEEEGRKEILSLVKEWALVCTSQLAHGGVRD